MWRWQVYTGVGLVVLVAVHWVVQHALVPGGLRTFQDVLAFLRQPLAVGVEGVLLLVVVIHAVLGLRSIALDLGLSPKAMRRVNGVLIVLALLMLAYGWYLLGLLRRLSLSP